MNKDFALFLSALGMVPTKPLNMKVRSPKNGSGFAVSGRPPHQGEQEKARRRRQRQAKK